MTRPGLLLAALAALAVAACNDVISTDGPASFSVQVVDAHYVATAEPGRALVANTPVTGAPVRLVWRGNVIDLQTDAAGLAVAEGVAASVTDRVTVAILGDGLRPPLVVYGWQHDQILLPLPTTSAPTLQPRATVVGDELTRIAGYVRGWVGGTGAGERGEAFLRWRHADGTFAGDVPADNDQYARTGIDVGSGNVTCRCEDEATQVCLAEPGNSSADCPCPQEAIVCEDPAGFAAGVSAFSFWVPPGDVEVGFVERVTNYVQSRFLETGRAFYMPVLPVPPGQDLDRQVLIASIDADQELCTQNAERAMEFVLQGLPRNYVIRARGELRMGLNLVSPFGLELPILLDEVWRQQDVVSSGATRQRVLVPYPFALADELSGFSYGYRIAATSAALPTTDHATPYRYEVQHVVASGIEDPCRVEVPMAPGESQFAWPTAAEPWPAGTAREILWSGPTTPLRRLLLRRADGTRALDVWLRDQSRVRITADDQEVLDWTPAAGTYELEYQLLDPAAAALTPDVLLRADVQLVEQLSSFYRQRHTFVVE